MWEKNFVIINNGKDDFRPGQRLVNYAYLVEHISGHELETWLWNLTPEEFKKIMQWSPE